MWLILALGSFPIPRSAAIDIAQPLDEEEEDSDLPAYSPSSPIFFAA